MKKAVKKAWTKTIRRVTKVMSTSKQWETGAWMEFEAEDEICHVVGSSQQTVSGGWRAYWEKHMNPQGYTWPTNCCIKGCTNPATMGAHIYLKKNQQNFILPTCVPCNNKKDEHYDGANTNWVEPNAGSAGVWVERHPNTFE